MSRPSMVPPSERVWGHWYIIRYHQSVIGAMILRINEELRRLGRGSLRIAIYRGRIYGLGGEGACKMWRLLSVITNLGYAISLLISYNNYKHKLTNQKLKCPNKICGFCFMEALGWWPRSLLLNPALSSSVRLCELITCRRKKACFLWRSFIMLKFINEN
jgi:hypothetical protein